MPNIRQQKKRVRIAAEERLENLHYRSTIKTLTKRLSTAVSDGDTSAIATERRSLEQLIDRAVARGALHRNAGARKKSLVARLASDRDA
jgi:small subunit ribosomal protein S20